MPPPGARGARRWAHPRILPAAISPDEAADPASCSSGWIPSSRPSSCYGLRIPPHERRFGPGDDDLSLPATTDRHRCGIHSPQGLPSGNPEIRPCGCILFRAFMVAPWLAHAGYFLFPIPGQPWARGDPGGGGRSPRHSPRDQLRGVPPTTWSRPRGRRHRLIGPGSSGVSMEWPTRLAEALHPALLIVFLVYMGRVIGTRKGVAGARAHLRPPSGLPAPPPVQGARHLRDHRRAHRRHLRTGFSTCPWWCPSSCCASLASGGRLVGFPQRNRRPARHWTSCRRSQRCRSCRCRAWSATSPMSARWL